MFLSKGVTQMKPKDLLEHLEKGDRSLEQLQAVGKIDQRFETQAMNQVFVEAFNQSLYGNSGLISSQTMGQNNIGGRVRWSQE